MPGSWCWQSIKRAAGEGTTADPQGGVEALVAIALRLADVVFGAAFNHVPQLRQGLVHDVARLPGKRDSLRCLLKPVSAAKAQQRLSAKPFCGGKRVTSSNFQDVSQSSFPCRATSRGGGRSETEGAHLPSSMLGLCRRQMRARMHYGAQPEQVMQLRPPPPAPPHVAQAQHLAQGTEGTLGARPQLRISGTTPSAPAGPHVLPHTG